MSKVLVIGDICRDVFHYVKCERLCPEAPVPVVTVVETSENDGMAGNVARNIQSLGLEVDSICNKEEITKTRYVDDNTNQMFIRVDSENKISQLENLESIDFSKYDAVVVSDYDKGFLSEEDIAKISKLHPLTFLDTKKYLGGWCKDITYIKINSFEYERTLHTIMPDDEHDLVDKMIITKGSNGCVYRDKTYPVEKVDVKDLSGAGDTFLAGLVWNYITSGKDIDSAIECANKCATRVVEQRGVSTCYYYKLKK